MADTKTTATPAVSPAENVEKWLGDKIDAIKGEPAPETAATATEIPASTWRDATLDGDDVPENFRGKKAADLLASWSNAQDAVRRMQSERDRAWNETQALRMKDAAQEAVSRVMPKQEPPSPAADDRMERLHQHLLLGEFEPYQKLLDEIHSEKIQKEVSAAEERAAAKAIETFQRNQSKGNMDGAYNAAVQHLSSLGITPTQEQMMAVYVNLTHEGNKYRPYGGPEHPSNVVAQYKDLFGLPEPTAAASQAAPTAPVKPPAPAAPPGANKPAMAAAPPAPNVTPLRTEMRDAAESMAEGLGWSDEQRAKFMNRLARAKGA